MTVEGPGLWFTDVLDFPELNVFGVWFVTLMKFFNWDRMQIYNYLVDHEFLDFIKMVQCFVKSRVLPSGILTKFSLRS